LSPPCWASRLQAFTLEIGFFLFFLPYTMFYNWAYDTLRENSLSVASNDAPWQANPSLAGRRSGQTPSKQLRSPHNYGKLHAILMV
jgi:hypothetical protein